MSRAWRKVVASVDEVLRRDHNGGSVTLSKAWKLTLECKHVVIQPCRSRSGPSDRIVCKRCEEAAKKPGG